MDFRTPVAGEKCLRTRHPCFGGHPPHEILQADEEIIRVPLIRAHTPVMLDLEINQPRTIFVCVVNEVSGMRVAVGPRILEGGTFPGVGTLQLVTGSS